MIQRRIVVNVDAWKRLAEEGLLPPNCRRFVIDSGHPQQPAALYYECYGDEELLNKVIAELLIGVKNENA